ncbi:hypothetical protein B0T18DRAFT_388945 [Schizothecium vesticola]|uniref:Uncharacterized protein n=1 Tax=Schizothecium vesticola TaxID=314040 RepID=A0AA40F181_9PEZI|nr:hypothetical protein B0T18DRAFT_388945 [Schizothecium vesticola]
MDPTSSPTDDITVLNIIDRLTSDLLGHTDDGSSETKASQERILARAKRALSDPAIDRDDLHEKFKMVIRMADMERIFNMAKSMEESAKTPHRAQLRKHYMTKEKDPMTWYEASEMEEIGHIRSWSIAGRKAEEAPGTPYLDRLEHLSVVSKTTRRDLLGAIRIYSERNEAFHNLEASIDKNIKNDGTVDWVSIREKCEEKKTSLDADLLAGRLSKKQRDQFHVFVDQWLQLKLDGKSQIEAKALSNFETAVAKREKEKTTPPPHPFPSIYTDGKWDDIDL